jgi:IS30 family transposase
MAVRMSVAEKLEIWRLVRDGVSFRVIGRQLGRSDASIRGYVGLTGGIRPPKRSRAVICLSLVEREEISRGLAAGESLRVIAGRLRRAPSTISREVTRNGGGWYYRAAVSDQAAWARARRPKRCKLATNERLRQAVAGKLCEDWSPQQIAGWLVREFPDEPEMRVSHETIYLTLFVQSRGALKRELATHLRTRRMMRRSKTHTARGHGRGQIVDAIAISERPAEAEDRAVPGHWEGDLLIGSGRSQIATLVERSTRFVMLVQLPKGRSTEQVVDALAAHVQTLPAQLRRSLTWDRGLELADHKRFTIDTGVQVYFCDPKSPWQRGSNENTNGLLRQYFPKGTSIAGFTQEQLDEVAAKLNGRPRQTLGWMTPSEKLDEVLR